MVDVRSDQRTGDAHMPVSRRSVLAGGLGAVTVGKGRPLTAHPSSPGRSSDPVAPDPADERSHIPFPTWGGRNETIHATAFTPADTTLLGRAMDPSGGAYPRPISGTVIMPSPQSLWASFSLPPSAWLGAVRFRVRSTTGAMRVSLVGGPPGATVAPSPAEQTIELGYLPPPLDGDNRVLLRADFDQLDGSQVLFDVLIGYNFQPPNIAMLSQPLRVYDSRQVREGKFRADETRIIQVDSGRIGSPKAVILNLTVTETEGDGGFCALWPSTTSPWPGNSSINWWGPGQHVANTLITDVVPQIVRDPFRWVSCLVAVNPAHVVLDVLGAFTFGYSE